MEQIDQLVCESWPLWEMGGPVVCPEFNWVIFSSNGGTTSNDNILLLGFIKKNAMPSLAVKVCRRPENSWTLKNEYENLCTLWEHLGKDAENRLPKPLALQDFAMGHAFLTNFVAGDSLLHATGPDLWQNPKKRYQLFQDAARYLRFIHHKTRTPIENREILSTDFQKKCRIFSEMFLLSPGESRILQSLNQQVEQITASAQTKVFVHGDFWHGNMIRRTGDNALILLDWQYGHWAADAGLDTFLFLLAGALYTAPFGPPEQRAFFAAQVINKWESDLIPAYLKTCGFSKDSHLTEKQGMLAACVEMSMRPVYYFKNRHHDDIMWRTLFRKLSETMK